jgi:ATP-binding cassette subfamily B protein
MQAINIRYMILNAGHVENNVPYDIRKAAFEKLQTLPLTYYDKTPVGWIMARLTSDCRKLGQTLSWNLVDLFWSLSNMTIAAIAMLLTNWRLALLVLVTVPPLILVSLEFQKRILANFRKVRKLKSQETAKITEGITGAKTIKSLSVEKPMLEEFAATTGSMRNFAVKAATINSFYTPIIMLLGSIASGLVFWQGGLAMKNGSLGVT